MLQINKKLWKKDYNPTREIILWGLDENNNPSFLILYGQHEFKEKNYNGYDEIRHILEDDVEYNSYAVFKGSEGHFPSFQAVKIMEPYSNRDNEPAKMYYKTGLKNNGWSWSKDEKYLVNEFHHLEEENKISLPYFAELSYEQLVNEVKKKYNNFVDFTLVNNPNEILNLEEDLSSYYSIICEIISNNSLYMRKKALKELMESDAPKKVYELLFKIGSTELLSGIFLDAARNKNKSFIEEAKSIIHTNINYGEKSYTKGLKRCANLYINSMSKELIKEREKVIKGQLSFMDLNLIALNGKDIPCGRILEGINYRKYSYQGLLSEMQGRYDYESRKYIRYRSEKRYEESIYSDGVVLNTLELKNTIQEAESYGLADVIGKIAYYLDAPRLTYYFKGNSMGKTLKYYKRYVRKIIDSYAEHEPEMFMRAMEAMLTSYTKYDYTCKFKGNFQFNDLLKHYLYFDFNEKAPEGWRNWYARYEWNAKDQLLWAKGRFEFKKEIWDSHLEYVLRIAANSKIDTISKVCYFILKDSSESEELINNLSYIDLIKLTKVEYKPLSKLFIKVLKKRVKSMNGFNLDLTMDLLLLDDIEGYKELIKENIKALNGVNYLQFVQAIIENNDKFKKLEVNLDKEIIDLISDSTNNINFMSNEDKCGLILYIMKSLQEKPSMIDWVQKFVEEVIFTLSYEELEEILNNVTIDKYNKAITKKNMQINSILQSIKDKKMLSDENIISILETGTSKSIKILIDILNRREIELKERFSTVLIMMECNITVLNNKAEEIFDMLEKADQKRLHSIILDSPVKKVYEFAIKKIEELYGERIPKEFVSQMLQHSSFEVKAYISNKSKDIIDNLAYGEKEVFLYYVRTLLLLPNKVSKSKTYIYEALPRFVAKYNEERENMESLLLDIGGSNTIKDSEEALIALANIRREAATYEG